MVGAAFSTSAVPPSRNESTTTQPCHRRLRQYRLGLQKNIAALSTEASREGRRVEITSEFPQPAPMDWAK